MVENRSLTIERDFLARIKPLICCSKSQTTCYDNEFCTTDSDDWPTIDNGTVMVRLAYPKDDHKSAISGIGGFCDAYINWHVNSGCGALAEEIAGAISDANRHTAPSVKEDFHGGLLSFFMDQKKLQSYLDNRRKHHEAEVSEVRNALLRRCSIMYDTVNGEKVFNKNKAEDLDEVANFCVNVQSAQKNEFKWWDFFKGGGTLAILWFFFWLLYRVIIFFKVGGSKLQDSGFIIRGLSDGINAVAGGIRHLFWTSIPYLGRTLWGVVTFRWARGVPPPTLKEDPTDSGDAPASGPKIVGQPQATSGAQPTATDDAKPAPEAETTVMHVLHPDIVLMQFAALSETGRYKSEGERFQTLSDVAKKYLAHLAIDRWNSVPDARKLIYIAEDRRLTEGQLPFQFLLSIARHQLPRDSSIKFLEASARIWKEHNGANLQRENPAPISEFHPESFQVQRQLAGEPRFRAVSDDVQAYIVKMAISEWVNLSTEGKRSFVSVEDKPEMGILPLAFVRFFRKRELRGIKDIERSASIFSAIAWNVPDMVGQTFYFIDRRLRQIIYSWKILPREVRKEFRTSADSQKVESAGGIPLPFIEYMLKIISIGDAARLPTRISQIPWSYNGLNPMIYQEFDVGRIMHWLSELNDMLRYYPELLRIRATTIVEAWLLLSDEIKDAFAMLDQEKELKGKPQKGPRDKDIPLNFIKFLHESNSGIGVKGRETTTVKGMLDDDGSDDENSGNGGMGNSGPNGRSGPVPGPQSQAGPYDGSSTDRIVRTKFSGANDDASAAHAPPNGPSPIGQARVPIGVVLPPASQISTMLTCQAGLMAAPAMPAVVPGAAVMMGTMPMAAGKKGF